MSPQGNVYDKKIILLVEGDPDDELLTLRTLEEAGIKNEVVVARDGEEALNCLFARGAYAETEATVLPQLILLEPKLPKMDGLQVLERLRADEPTRHLPVAVFSSSEEEKSLMERQGPNGNNAYIRKPLDLEQFCRALRQLGLSWLVLGAP